MKGWMYILECNDGSYYTGSTIDLKRRIKQDQNGEGSNHTKKRLPVRLLYTEEFSRISDAFYREKQIQKWSRKKKEALMNGELGTLVQLSKNYTENGRPGTSASSVTGMDLIINSVTDEDLNISPINDEGLNINQINNEKSIIHSDRDINLNINPTKDEESTINPDSDEDNDVSSIT